MADAAPQSDPWRAVPMRWSLELDVRERTLRRRCRALFDKLGVTGRVEAAAWAARHGLIQG